MVEDKVAIAKTHPLAGMMLALSGFAIYSTHDALIKSLGSEYSVFQIIFFTMVFACVPMTATMLADRRVDNFIPKKPFLVILRSVMMILGTAGTFHAFSVLPLAEAYALLFSFPIIVTVLSVPVLGERVGLLRTLAVIFGFCGVLVVLRPASTELSLGHAAALLAAISAASSSVLVRKIGRGERSAVLILYPMLLTIAATAALLPWVYQPMPLGDLAKMALLGLLSVTAQHVIIHAYRMARAAIVSPMQYSQIVWATIFGVLFFDEIPDIYVFIGAIMVIASGLFMIWRESIENVSARQPVTKTAPARTGPPRVD